MIRRLITAASVISLVLCVSSLSLWLLSYRQAMGMTADWTTAIADNPYGELPVDRMLRAEVVGGRVVLRASGGP